MAIKSTVYRLHNHGEEEPRGGDRYAHLTLEIIIGQSYDAAKQYDADPSDDAMERLRKIREQGESAKYFVPAYHRAECRLQWMCAKSSHIDHGTEWFACRLDAAEFNADILRLLGKLRKATEEMYDNVTPTAILSALHSLKARRVVYANDVYDAWIYQDEATFDDIALPANWIDSRLVRIEGSECTS